MRLGLYTFAEAAEDYGICVESLKKLCGMGSLHARTPVGLTRPAYLCADELDALFAGGAR